MHQPYRWQVGLHQSLSPLQIDVAILNLIILNSTNHFWPHYQPNNKFSNANFLETGAALGIEAVILFERYEQKDNSVKPDPQGNAQIKEIMKLRK